MVINPSRVPPLDVQDMKQSKKEAEGRKLLIQPSWRPLPSLVCTQFLSHTIVNSIAARTYKPHTINSKEKRVPPFANANTDFKVTWPPPVLYEPNSRRCHTTNQLHDPYRHPSLLERWGLSSLHLFVNPLILFVKWSRQLSTLSFIFWFKDFSKEHISHHSFLILLTPASQLF